MRRLLCTICLVLAWPYTAYAAGLGDFYIERPYQQQKDTEAFSIGLAFHDRINQTTIGLALSSITDGIYSPEPQGYGRLYLYMGGESAGAVTPFYEAGMDVLTVLSFITNLALSDLSCNATDYYDPYNNCDYQEFIPLHPNIFFTIGVKLKSSIGGLAMFWRYYWLNDGINPGRGRNFLGVRYSLRF